MERSPLPPRRLAGALALLVLLCSARLSQCKPSRCSACRAVAVRRAAARSGGTASDRPHAFALPALLAAAHCYGQALLRHVKAALGHCSALPLPLLMLSGSLAPAAPNRRCRRRSHLLIAPWPLPSPPAPGVPPSQEELVAKLDAEQPRNHIDLQHRVGPDGKRWGKTIEYK